MEDKLCEAIEDIEYILLSAFNEYSSKNEDSKFLTSSIDSYYTDNDIFNRPTIPKDRVLEDRKKIIDILSLFYEENKDREDDFVTLFAIYCNNYIRYNFHQILSDEDFGLSELFDLIDDYKLKKYLKLIQKGIYKQDISFFDEANAEISKYSVANIYLFIFSIRDYSIDKYKKESIFEKQKDNISKLCRFFDETPIYNYSEQENSNNSPKLLEYFDNISEKLQRYLLGKDNLFEHCYYKYPLPYLKVVNNEIEFQDFIVQYFSDYCKKMKSFNENNLDSDKNKIYKKILSSIYDLIRKVEDFKAKDGVTRKQYINSDVIEDRKLYLGIPSVVFNSEYYISLILEQNRLNKELEKEKEEQIRLNKEKLSIVGDFTHKYYNMQASNLQEIADILLSSDNEEYRKEGRKVLFEYANKESLSKDVYMMRLMVYDDINTLYEMLRDSLLDINDPSKKVIEDVIDMSLVFCLINVFYNNHSRFIKMRENLEELLNENLDDFKEDFQTEVIFRKENCAEWLRNRDINFILNGLENWDSIALNSEDYAFIYLKDIFQELFLNYFKHGNLKKPIVINLSSTKDRFIISAENYLCDNKYEEKIGFESTATGLISFAKILPKLYEENLPVEECFRVIHKKDIFRVEIEIPRKRFVLE